MRKTRTIGWQKYEDLIENQLSSPHFQKIMKSVAENLQPEELQEEPAEYYTQEEYDEHQVSDSFILPVPVTEDLSNEIALMSSFDCWIGHTNFDITPSIKETLNEINGVEILKICSRYRFFIGVGRMFDFKNVREEIENTIGDDYGVDFKRED
tara:strand:+ start:12084 stop:12542 length:459 start_codon:yes stop_codon:yes gene_type:complete